MKKKLRKWIIVLTLGLLLGMMTMPAIAEEYTFRKTIWGMNREQVKETEKEKEIAYEDERTLSYEDSILELDCSIVYIFVEGKLVRTKYAITERHSNGNKYIEDYSTLKVALNKKYGEPLELEKIIWEDDRFKKDRKDWGVAIGLGELVYVVEWETSETEIVLILDGDNFEIRLEIQYISKELKELEKKEKEKEALGVL